MWFMEFIPPLCYFTPSTHICPIFAALRTLLSLYCAARTTPRSHAVGLDRSQAQIAPKLVQYALTISSSSSSAAACKFDDAAIKDVLVLDAERAELLNGNS